MTPFAGTQHLAACHFPLEIAIGAPATANAAAPAA
jgi:hypothetical protein